MLETSTKKKRAVGLLLFAVILAMFFTFNRLPKLDIVGGDLEAINAPEVQCFQGFCIEREPGRSSLERWVVFSLTYLRLVTVGMTFAFVVAGLTESFLFSSSSGTGYASGSVFKRTVRGLAIGPVMNLCSACIVPVSTAFQRRGGGIEGAIAMVQGSATMNIPALAMVFFVFTPLLGLSRLVLALVGALLIGPLVVLAVSKGHREKSTEPEPLQPSEEGETTPWGPVLTEAFRDWGKTSVGYLVRMGPIMVVAGFASGLAIQWISPQTISTYLGNDILGVAIAATFGILINVPLLFEIPLVALLLLLGMGTAPAATLLFTAAAGGPITFWGLAKIMPKRALATFATATWSLGLFGGLGVLGIGAVVWDQDTGLRVAAAEGSSATKTAGRKIETGTEVRPATVAVVSGDGSLLFADATASAGVGFRHTEFFGELIPLGGGVVVLDFNGDGYDDLYVPNSDGANALYRNNGDRTFTEVAGPVGVLDQRERGNGGCAADYDNDGDQDLYVTNYGASKLFRNNGDGSFANVTLFAGLDDTDDYYRSTGCAWGDYDLDGSVDLIVVRHLAETHSEMLEDRDFSAAIRHPELYHSNGDGTFTKVTRLLGDLSAASGLLGGPGGNLWGAGFQPGWVDLDNDGDLDLYVINDYGNDIQPNVLWRNDGPGTDGSWSFVDISKRSGAGVPMFGMGLAVGDYDLDGFLDLFVTNIADSVLLRNTGDGLRFTDTATEAGVGIGTVGEEQRVAWATVFFDYDNDGDEDLYVVSGYLRLPAQYVIYELPRHILEQPNVLLRNRGDGTFEDVSLESGADDRGIGRGGVFLDFDNDGCLDLFVINLGQEARLFRNACGSDNGWLVVDTVGTVSNRDGIGARITVIAGGTTQIREVASGSGQMGQNMMAAHFGLGTATAVDSVTIRWPSGVVQTLTDLKVNQRLTVTEPE